MRSRRSPPTRGRPPRNSPLRGPWPGVKISCRSWGPGGPDRLRETLAATEIRLSDEDFRRIDEVLPPGAAAGDRYDAHQMALVNR